MDIGIEQAPYVLEPVEDPVPGWAPAPEQAPEPSEVPDPVPAGARA